MRPEQEFSDLIGRIYDSALDSSQWPNVLARIADQLDAAMADLSVVDPLNGTGVIAAFYNWPQDLLILAMEHFNISPARGVILTAPLLEPMCTSRHLDITAFHNSRYWRTCFAERGYYDYLVTGLTRQATRLSSWGVLGTESRGPFDDEDIELARLLSPHIQRSLNISGVLNDRRVEAGTLRGALDELAAAAFIVEPDCRIRYSNAAGHARLEEENLFREIKGRLIGVTGEASRLLTGLQSADRHQRGRDTLLRDPAGRIKGRLIGVTGEASRLLTGLQSADRHQRGRDTLLRDPAGRMTHVTWATLEQVGEELGSPILLLLRQPEPDLQTPVSVAHSSFKLTRAETQVLTQILEGHSLVEVAAVLGVARSTVKTHLEAIYAKTGTHRLPDLVRLIVGLISPLRE